MQGKHLTTQERFYIEKRLSEGASQADIARAHSQLKCNKVTPRPERDKIPALAQMELPLYAGKTPHYARAVLHRKEAQ